MDVSVAPYGYIIVGTKQERKYVVDEEAASVIRKIYAWTFDGMGPKEIVRRLDLLHIPTPKEHYKELIGKKSVHKSTKWNVGTIQKIIRNETYTGTLRVNKTRTPNYKVNKIVEIPEEEQIIREDDHEAIISKDEFDLMQDMLSRDMRVSARNRNFAFVYPLAGYIYCGDCGGTMCSSKIRNKEKLYEYYVCGEHKKNIKICSTHSIRKEKVESVVLKAINLQLHILFEADDLLDGRSLELLIKPELDKIEAQISRILEDKEKISKYAGELLQDFRDGILTREEYEELKEDSEKEMEELEEKASVLIQEKDSRIRKELARLFWLRQYKDIGELKNLNRRDVVTFLDRVEVFDGNHIKIRFRFGDEFKRFLKENRDIEEGKGATIHG